MQDLSSMKKLPIGIQSFSKLIEEQYVYVDKTKYYHRLISESSYYFLSRPRRFGKSLLINTLKEIFLGNRDLFQGLWIQDKIDWQPRPVIKLDFSLIVSRETPLPQTIDRALDRLADEHGLPPLSGDYAEKFQSLIQQLGRERKVAILIDEYDKPIINYIEKLDMAEENRAVMKNFYSVIKGNDEYIAFFMLTGVSKFSQVSIFSDLNNLNDISLDPNYAQMLGYTQEEMVQYFPDYLQALNARWASTFPDVMAEVKNWYNGYSWDGITTVYNPFSILNLFSHNTFSNYWFATGTPTFLTRLIKTHPYSILDLQDQEISLRSFNKFDLTDIDINSLLFQTGYLTIKSIDPLRQTVRLDYPNREVSDAFTFYLLNEFSEKGTDQTDALVIRMANQLRDGDPTAFVESLKRLFDGIAYPIQPVTTASVEQYENYYHSMFYFVLRLLGYDAQAEVFTSRGRIDAMVTTQQHIYIFEFKLGDAQSAITQIHEKRYHHGFLGTGKQVFLVGIGFDTKTRNVGEYLVEKADTTAQ